MSGRGWLAVPVDLFEALIEMAAPKSGKWPMELVHADLLLAQDLAVAHGIRWPTIAEFQARWGWSHRKAVEKAGSVHVWGDPAKKERFAKYLGSIRRSGGKRVCSASQEPKKNQKRTKQDDRTPKDADYPNQGGTKREPPLGAQTQPQELGIDLPSTPDPLHPPAPERHLPGQGPSPSRSRSPAAAETLRDGTSPPADSSGNNNQKKTPIQPIDPPPSSTGKAPASFSEAPGQGAQPHPRGVSQKAARKGNNLSLYEHARRAIESAATLAERESLIRGDHLALSALRVVIRNSGGPAAFRLRELAEPAAKAADMTVLFEDGRGLADLAYGRRRKRSPPPGAVSRGAAPPMNDKAQIEEQLMLTADRFREEAQDGTAIRHVAAMASPLDDHYAFEDACSWFSMVRWSLDCDFDPLREVAETIERICAAAGLDVRTVRA